MRLVRSLGRGDEASPCVVSQRLVVPTLRSVQTHSFGGQTHRNHVRNRFIWSPNGPRASRLTLGRRSDPLWTSHDTKRRRKALRGHA